jgi:hypothetical protein
MAQANPEHGNDVEKALDKRNLVGEHGRVTGTGRISDGVRLMGQEGGPGR